MSSKFGIVANNPKNSGKVIINGKPIGVRPTYLKRGKRKLNSVVTLKSEETPRITLAKGVIAGNISGKVQVINRIGDIVKSNEGALITVSNRNNIEQLFACLD